MLYKKIKLSGVFNLISLLYDALRVRELTCLYLPITEQVELECEYNSDTPSVMPHVSPSPPNHQMGELNV